MTDLVGRTVPGDQRPLPRRVWAYRRGEWEPSWPFRIGAPYRGGDEWGRRTVVVGLWFLGYVVWAWRTCWCAECHEMREQSYRLRYEDVSDEGHRRD